MKQVLWKSTLVLLVLAMVLGAFGMAEEAPAVDEVFSQSVEEAREQGEFELPAPEAWEEGPEAIVGDGVAIEAPLEAITGDEVAVEAPLEAIEEQPKAGGHPLVGEWKMIESRNRKKDVISFGIKVYSVKDDGTVKLDWGGNTGITGQWDDGRSTLTVFNGWKYILTDGVLGGSSGEYSGIALKKDDPRLGNSGSLTGTWRMTERRKTSKYDDVIHFKVSVISVNGSEVRLSWGGSGMIDGKWDSEKKTLTVFEDHVYVYRWGMLAGGSPNYSGVAFKVSDKTDVAISSANFPDEVFREWVSANVDKNGDGVLTPAECEKVKRIDLTHGYVSNLKGIGFFPNLQSLKCSGNSLEELDVSKNTKLVSLDCINNQLKELDVSKNTKLTDLYCSNNQLKELDVSRNTKLESLYCDFNQLKKLDVSKNTKLEVFECFSNELTSLNVSKNTKLTKLYCYYNTLKKLDVSRNTQLKYLYCGDNRLSKLDVSKCPKLELLQAFGNKLKKLDVSRNTQLKYLYCGDNRLSKLDVSRNTKLTILSCDHNQLKKLDVSGNTKLTTLNCGDNQLNTLPLKHKYLNSLSCHNNPSLSKIDIGKCPKLKKLVRDFDCDFNYDDSGAVKSVKWGNDFYGKGGCLEIGPVHTRLYINGDEVALGKPDAAVVPINSANFPDERFRWWLTSNVDQNEDGALTSGEREKIKKINVSTEGISSLKGISHFPNLQSLDCSGGYLTELDVSKNTNLTTLKCGRNQLSKLDVSKNTNLTTLDCRENQLTELDVSKNTNLTTLNCRENKLKKLDVSRNTKLTELVCSYNSLKKLDVSRNTKLTELVCSYNSLTKLDVSRNTGLLSLDYSDNSIRTLDTSKNTKLKALCCDGNKIASLDVSKNINLEELSCRSNRLTSLDVSKNINLKELSCGRSKLTSLDVSRNTKLLSLACDWNELTELDVSRNTALTGLYCNMNIITSLDVSGNPDLQSLDCLGNCLRTLSLNNEKLSFLSCYYNPYLSKIDIGKCPILKKVVQGRRYEIYYDDENEIMSVYWCRASGEYALFLNTDTELYIDDKLVYDPREIDRS